MLYISCVELLLFVHDIFFVIISVICLFYSLLLKFTMSVISLCLEKDQSFKLNSRRLLLVKKASQQVDL